jgi:hypothetical protein
VHWITRPVPLFGELKLLRLGPVVVQRGIETRQLGDDLGLGEGIDDVAAIARGLCQPRLSNDNLQRPSQAAEVIADSLNLAEAIDWRSMLG